MSRVIKSLETNHGGRVRPFRVPDPASAELGPSIDPEKTELLRQLHDAQARIRELDAQVDELRAEIPRAERAAEDRGRKAGMAEAEDRQAERLVLLKAGVAAAVEKFAAQTASLERLAPALAREALGRLVHDPEHRSDLLAGAVLSGVRSIDADALVRIDLAADDFPDLEPISEAVLQTTHRRTEVRHAADLAPGACRIRLALGEVDVGLDQKWDRLAGVLEELASPRVEP